MTRPIFARLACVAAALVLSAAGGCARSLVITNTSHQDQSLVQNMQGGDKTFTLHPGSSLTLDAATPIDLNGLLIQYK